jgi:NAD-dependent deacetylase
MALALESTLQQAADLLAKARRVACLTGAGVSAESGVATFRDAQTGLYAKFDPQQLASQAGFAADPGFVWRWYMARLSKLHEVEPNPGHRALAQLEASLPHFTLITQNVDDLHERAGSHNVIHLHGRINAFHCNECATPYLLQPAKQTAQLPPTCPHCRGWVRPSVVWFGELLPVDLLQRAQAAAASCDLMLVAGTSGVVYPAAALPTMAQHAGATLVDINPEPSPISQQAEIFLQGASGLVLPQLLERMGRKQ